MISEQALKDRLQFLAREKNIPFNACWKEFLLERFLVRLAHSVHNDHFIFKGGFLLAYLMKIGRETTDLDFLLIRLKADITQLQETFERIISTPSPDGFAFSFDSIELLSQPHMEYAGYRVVLNTRFSRIKDKVQIDVGVGDNVQPQIRQIPLLRYRGKPLFESTVSLLSYPIETIFSEKLETIISKGAGNSRMKDYHDLFLLIRAKSMLDSNKLKSAIANTFSHRGTPLCLIKFDEPSLIAIQKLWTAHLRALGNNARHFNFPSDISDVIEEINVCFSAIH